MNLCLDFGNTNCKAAIVENDIITQSFHFLKTQALQAIEDILLEFQPQKAIIASVIGIDPLIKVLLDEKCTQVLVLKAQTDLPFVNAYATPESLGVDRLALVAGAIKVFPGENCLVISIGTAITYNFITASKFFRGGAISPGPRLRFESLHTQTEKLPLIVGESGFAPILGFDTESSIRSGVINGIAGELEYFIQEFKKEHDTIRVVITGGYSSLFVNKIKNQIFADPKFLMKGLNLILNHNARL